MSTNNPDLSLVDFRLGSFNDMGINDKIAYLESNQTYLAINVANYGALGDGSDASTAMRSAVAAALAGGGGEVFIPNGTYLLDRDGGNFYCLDLPAGVTLRGQSRGGVILKQAPGIAASVRLLHISGDDVGVFDLTLDGNRSTQTVNDQRHGIFVDTCNRFHAARVTAKNFTGDGFFLYTGANHTVFFDCYSTSNDRNGLTWGGLGLDDCLLLGGQFSGNTAQQVDSEAGGPITNVALNGCYIDPGGASNDYVLTASGTGIANRSKGWTVTGCTINGPVFVVWCDDVSFIGNRGVSASTDKPHLAVYRKCVGVRILGNRFVSTLNAGSDKVTVHIFGTDNVNGDLPSGVLIQGNYVSNAQGAGMGIYVSAAEDVTVTNNKVIGAGVNTPGYWGIYVRSTLSSFPVRSAVVTGNHVKNWGSGAVAFGGSGAAQTLTADCSHNTFDSDVVGVQPIGVSFDVDGSHAVQKATFIGNNVTGNTASPISDYPNGGVVLIGGNYNERAIYSVASNPDGTLSASLGSMALNRAAGAGTTLYVKETGGTAWAAK